MDNIEIHSYLKLIVSQVKRDQHVDITDPVVNLSDLVVVQLQVVELQHVVEAGGHHRQAVVTQVQFRHPGQVRDGVREALQLVVVEIKNLEAL